MSLLTLSYSESEHFNDLHKGTIINKFKPYFITQKGSDLADDKQFQGAPAILAKWG